MVRSIYMTDSESKHMHMRFAQQTVNDQGRGFAACFRQAPGAHQCSMPPYLQLITAPLSAMLHRSLAQWSRHDPVASDSRRKRLGPTGCQPVRIQP